MYVVLDGFMVLYQDVSGAAIAGYGGTYGVTEGLERSLRRGLVCGLSWMEREGAGHFRLGRFGTIRC